MAEAPESALQYAGRGWSVLPCRDKVPLVRGGVHAATRDLATIERWWHTWPQANVAIACGAPSGVVVIDIDAPAEVTELFNLTTLCASTPSGGRNLYCRYAEGIRNRVFDWGEVRSTGLYVVAPPATGREWLSNSAIELIRNGIISSPAAEELLIEVAILNGYAANDGFIAAEKTIRSGLGPTP
jgi:hypothetical protein